MSPAVRPHVALAGPDLTAMLELSAQLGVSMSPTVIEAPQPVQSLLRQPVHAAAVVLQLTGSENVVDLRALLQSHQGIRFMFLAPSFPPHAAVARIIAEYGGTVLPAQGASIIAAATLVALLSPARNTAAG